MSDPSTGVPGGGGGALAFHIELRQFPHNLNRFNLGEHELRSTILEPWVREQWFEQGERKWNANQAKLTVLEGPPLPLEELSLGRGWRAAQRQGRDVTERMLTSVKHADAEARAAADGAPGEGSERPPAGAADREEGLRADSLGLELLAHLGAEPAPLRRAWDLARARHPERTAGESLVLAERAVSSLLGTRLIVLVRAGAVGEEPRAVEQADVRELLGNVDSWVGEILGMVRR